MLCRDSRTVANNRIMLINRFRAVHESDWEMSPVFEEARFWYFICYSVGTGFASQYRLQARKVFNDPICGCKDTFLSN